MTAKREFSIYPLCYLRSNIYPNSHLRPKKPQRKKPSGVDSHKNHIFSSTSTILFATLFAISKPQSTETFETVSHGELMLIGSPKLKSISISSFFPIRDYPYLRDKSMKGWEYVYKIDTWIDLKLPIRLIITETPINMAVAVKDFKYTIKTDGDLWYTLDLEEFNLLNYEDQNNAEDEIDMEELNKLKEQVAYLVGLVETLANPMIYNYIDENMPEWARKSVQKAVDKGVLSGTDEGWNLKYDDLRVIVWLDRLGLLE